MTEVIAVEYLLDDQMNILHIHADGKMVEEVSVYTNDDGAWTFNENVVQISLQGESFDIAGQEASMYMRVGEINPTKDRPREEILQDIKENPVDFYNDIMFMIKDGPIT